jgi:hypothetical protein
VIDAYRTQYAIANGDPRPLGPEPPAGAFRQRLDRRQAARQGLDTIDRRDHLGADTQLKQLREAAGPESDYAHDRSTIQPER